jgi:hypothetical protein
VPDIANISAESLIASLIVSSIGTVAFIYGKRQSRVPHMAVGVLLCIFPYFVDNLYLMAGITVLLLGILWGLVKIVQL